MVEMNGQDAGKSARGPQGPAQPHGPAPQRLEVRSGREPVQNRAASRSKWSKCVPSRRPRRASPRPAGRRPSPGRPRPCAGVGSAHVLTIFTAFGNVTAAGIGGIRFTAGRPMPQFQWAGRLLPASADPAGRLARCDWERPARAGARGPGRCRVGPLALPAPETRTRPAGRPAAALRADQGGGPCRLAGEKAGGTCA